jgi:hypothetical protein
VKGLARGGDELCVVGRVADRGQITILLAALRASRFDVRDISLFMGLERRAPTSAAGDDVMAVDRAHDTLRAFGSLGMTVLVSRAGQVLASGPLGLRGAASGGLESGIAALGLSHGAVERYARSVAEGGSIVCIQTPDRGSMSQARRILATCGAEDIEVGLVDRSSAVEIDGAAHRSDP